MPGEEEGSQTGEAGSLTSQEVVEEAEEGEEEEEEEEGAGRGGPVDGMKEMISALILGHLEVADLNLPEDVVVAVMELVEEEETAETLGTVEAKHCPDLWRETDQAKG
ncbi:hypothetical protein WMY93_021676 [Mugilogobius chulae]|uniref:Uncharacterized protein n=1 Tax=Mugilogobius chulae TaxID=88201 RepID=A0AAW0NNU0_9GOBI